MNAKLLLVSCLLFAIPLSAQDSPVVRQTLREWNAIRAADAIIVARVKRVHESPGVWSGAVVSEQMVTYQVVRIAHGKLRGDVVTVDVAHLLVADSPLVSKAGPFLRPELFYVGAQAVLCVSGDKRGHLKVCDSSYGVRFVDAPRQPDTALSKIVGAVLGLRSLRPYWHLEDPKAVPRCLLNDVTSLPLSLSVAGRPVEFLPAGLMGRKRHVEFTSLQRAKGRAEVGFVVRREGVVGKVRLVAEKGVWRVVEAEVVER